MTNGIYYTVEGWNDETVSLRMHPDFAQNHIDKVKDALQEMQPMLRKLVPYLRESQRSLKQAEAFASEQGCTNVKALAKILRAIDFQVTKESVMPPENWPEENEEEGVNPDLPSEAAGPTAFDLSWAEFGRTTRLTHALPYVYYQGKTIKNQNLLLMGTQSRHYTMRHLIVGLGRVQKSKHVSICPAALEETMLQKGKEIYDKYDQRAKTEAAAVAPALDADGDVVMDEPTDPFCAAPFDDDVDDDDVDDDQEPVTFEDPFGDDAFDDV